MNKNVKILLFSAECVGCFHSCQRILEIENSKGRNINLGNKYKIQDTLYQPMYLRISTDRLAINTKFLDFYKRLFIQI